MQIQWEIDWLGLDNDPYQQIIYLYWYKNYTKTIYGKSFQHTLLGDDCVDRGGRT